MKRWFLISGSLLLSLGVIPFAIVLVWPGIPPTWVVVIIALMAILTAFGLVGLINKNLGR